MAAEGWTIVSSTQRVIFPSKTCNFRTFHFIFEATRVACLHILDQNVITVSVERTIQYRLTTLEQGCTAAAQQFLRTKRRQGRMIRI